MEQAYRVSQVNAYIRNLLEEDRLLARLNVEGEVSNCRYASSGHIYFSLKERDAQLLCVMFASARRTGLTFRLQDGMQVRVTGRVSVYERDGQYQLYATSVARAGLGALYEELERRKKELYAEGLFDEAHKKPLPEYPKRIGIVTAAGGAALQDILQILRRRNPYLQPILSPCQVQGEGAAESICRAIRKIAKAGVDVIIVGRGGGSIEDLWAYNEEAVVRTVYECETPIVSAVGHEINTTLIDYAADVVAPTPSAAAELVSNISEDLSARLVDMHVMLLRAMTRAMEGARQKLSVMAKQLRYYSPADRLARDREAMEDARERLRRAVRQSVAAERVTFADRGNRLRTAMRQRVMRARAELGVLAARLDGVSPTKTLGKGYAFLTAEGAPVASVAALAPGKRIRGYVADGGFDAEVIRVYRNDEGDGDAQ